VISDKAIVYNALLRQLHIQLVGLCAVYSKSTVVGELL